MIIVQFLVTSVPELFFGNQPMKATWLYLTLCNPMNYTYSPWNSPGQNTGGGSCFLHQGIFPTQGLNPDLLCWGWILYQLSHQGSPLRILEWVTYPFSHGSSWPRSQTRSPTLQADALPAQLPRGPVLAFDRMAETLKSRVTACVSQYHSR